MRNAVLVSWALFAWITPAALAGALGWTGIWGSGSAFADYLMPLPVAGGALHLPSFLVVSALLLTQPWAGRAGGLVYGVLLAGALAGVTLLLDVTALKFAYTTDASGGSYWQENPLGLFALSDCLIALFFAAALGARAPTNMPEWLLSLVVVLMLPLFCVQAVLQADPRQQATFVYGGSRGGEVRGDSLVFYFTKVPPSSADFNAALPELVARHDPISNINDEDIAIYLFDSLAAAQAQDASRASYTVCLYQDGSPMLRAPGRYDCFRLHETFSERVDLAYERQDAALPQDVRRWLAQRAACAGRRQMTAPPGVYLDNQEVRACDPVRSARARDELLVQFGSDGKVADALK